MLTPEECRIDVQADPEDIHQLATGIDEILDHLDSAAYRFEAYGTGRSAERMPEIARMVKELTKRCGTRSS
jgi:uncharacterized protein Yka (UPF0111/DUF47 family)